MTMTSKRALRDVLEKAFDHTRDLMDEVDALQRQLDEKREALKSSLDECRSLRDLYERAVEEERQSREAQEPEAGG